jgi:hypothetical protein
VSRLNDRIERRLAYRRRRRRPPELLELPELGWLRLASAGMLHPGHVALIDRAVSELPTDDPVVEVGAFAGLSTVTLALLLGRHARVNPLFSTDPWQFERPAGEDIVPGTRIPFADYRAHVRAQFEANVRFWSGERLPHAFELPSDAFFAAWADGGTRRDLFGQEAPLGGPISLCFVDGDHRLEQARRDVDNADRFLVTGGFLLLDDSDRFGAFPHLYDLVQELVAAGRYELVGENPHHLLRKLA